MIKTYEGFLSNLFKKKKDLLSKEPDIKDCLYDLIDNSIDYKLRKSDEGFLIMLNNFDLVPRSKKDVDALIYGFSMKEPLNKLEISERLLEIKGHLSDIDPDIRLFYVDGSGTGGRKPESLTFATKKNWLVIGFSYNDQVKLISHYQRKNPLYMFHSDWVEIKLN
jgi:hypothetical protein